MARNLKKFIFQIPDSLHTLRMSKKGYDFIKCDLSQENLTSQLELNIGELVFAKGIGTFNPSGFVGGHLVAMVRIGICLKIGSELNFYVKAVPIYVKFEPKIIWLKF